MSSATSKIVQNFSKIRSLSSLKRSFTAGKVIYTKQPPASTGVPTVPGLTKAVVDVPNEPVGPGAAKNTDYKNPEYFCYDKSSYFEAEVEMLKYRCPQPSTTVYFKPPQTK